jgi:hypothetical protein
MTLELDPCEICKMPARAEGAIGDYVDFDCPRCGPYRLTGSAMPVIRRLADDARAKLSGWVRDQDSAGSRAIITAEAVQMISSLPAPGIQQRAERLLLTAAKRTPRYGEWINIGEPIYTACAYAHDFNETYFIAKVLADRGWIRLLSGSGDAEVTGDGFLAAEELRTKGTDSSQGFVAMWFSPDLQRAYDLGLAQAIANSGYRPLRVDGVEHAGRIDDEIIAQIRRSRFVVADYTGHRGGVYFEAGFAMGLGLPVFFTCRKADLAGLHFDVRQYNTIDWATPEELCQRLTKRISAVIGDGPLRENRSSLHV